MQRSCRRNRASSHRGTRPFPLHRSALLLSRRTNASAVSYLALTCSLRHFLARCVGGKGKAACASDPAGSPLTRLSVLSLILSRQSKSSKALPAEVRTSLCAQMRLAPRMRQLSLPAALPSVLLVSNSAFIEIVERTARKSSFDRSSTVSTPIRCGFQMCTSPLANSSGRVLALERPSVQAVVCRYNADNQIPACALLCPAQWYSTFSLLSCRDSHTD